VTHKTSDSQTPAQVRAHATSPVWRAHDDLLRSIPGTPGAGPVDSLTLVADLPELGRLSHGQIAALVGAAPESR
jgi:transposase